MYYTLTDSKYVHLVLPHIKKNNYRLTAGVCAAIRFQQQPFPFAIPIHITKHDGTAKAAAEK